MTKKLEIKFVKFEKALAIQVLNQEGLTNGWSLVGKVI